MRLISAAFVAILVLFVSAAQSADTLDVHLVSQTSTTITLGWTPQTGYGYLFFDDCVTIDTGCSLVSRTNDAAASSVTFAKGHNIYKVSVITEGNRGTYTAAAPPGPPTATFTISPSPAATGQNVTFDWTGTCPAGGCTIVWEDEGPDGPGGTEYPLGTGDPYSRAFMAVGTKYIHLVVTDSLGASAESRQNLSVSNTPPPTDTTPPTVTVTGPANGATVSGTINETASASDNVGVTRVEFLRDGNLFATDTTSPYSASLDTTTVANGSHTLGARAFDAANNTGTATNVTVTVSNVAPPNPQCSDGIDNADPEDTLIDLADPGCTNASDNDETDPVVPPPGCNLNATPANFASQVAAATAGQTICLASGSYGTFAGTNKAIIIVAASGASPQMQVNFGSGDSGFTLDGMTNMGGSINGASNVTIRNSTFTDTFDVDGNNTNVVLDGNTHNWNTSGSTGPNSKIGLGGGNGTIASPAVTIRNSQFKNGDLDGIFIGGGSGYLILNNVFDNLCDTGTNHTDQIQFADTSPAVTQTRIAGNYIHANNGCGTQGITSYDHGTNGVIIENNVVDIHRPWGIELYSDVNSIVRHNTVVWWPDAQCDFTGQSCGQIDINRKSADPAGTGTHVYDNVANVGFGNGSTGTADHNVSGQTAVYVGPTNFHDGFLLAPSSPVGKNAASDGTDAGVFHN